MQVKAPYVAVADEKVAKFDQETRTSAPFNFVRDSCSGAADQVIDNVRCTIAPIFCNGN